MGRNEALLLSTLPRVPPGDRAEGSNLRVGLAAVEAPLPAPVIESGGSPSPLGGAATMIPIRIATRLSEEGVGEVRWVLLDPAVHTAAQASDAPVPQLALPVVPSAPAAPSTNGVPPAGLNELGASAAQRTASWGQRLRHAGHVVGGLRRAALVATALIAAGWLAASMADRPASMAATTTAPVASK